MSLPLTWHEARYLNAAATLEKRRPSGCTAIQDSNRKLPAEACPLLDSVQGMHTGRTIPGASLWTNGVCTEHMQKICPPQPPASDFFLEFCSPALLRARTWMGIPNMATSEPGSLWGSSAAG